MSILDYFPYDQPRPSQLQVLKWVEKNWHKYDVFVLQAPVACGKSGLAVTIARWANTQGCLAGITTPDNVLVRQYVRDFNLPVLPSKYKFVGDHFFHKAREEFKKEKIKVMNNHTLLANRIYSDLQIMDEAHQLIPMLQDMEGMKIWRHLVYYPDGLKTVADVLLWAGQLKACQDKKLKTIGTKLVRLLQRNPKDYTIVHEKDIYRNKEQDCLRIYPLTPKNNKPILWPPSKVKKLVLMSATIASPDIEDLGLHNRRVGYIEVPSDIPPANRPVIYAGQGHMGRKRTDKVLEKCLNYVHGLAQKDPRGFVHSTYALASKIEKQDWFLKHGAMDKKRVLEWWMTGKPQQVFIGCGLTTGLNLKGNLCHWQCILKCQFPDLGDPAVMSKAQKSPDWYAWTTIKQLVQAYGRVCRAPDDYGATFLLDSDFAMLYTKYNHLFPSWFKEALEI